MVMSSGCCGNYDAGCSWLVWGTTSRAHGALPDCHQVCGKVKKGRTASHVSFCRGYQSLWKIAFTVRWTADEHYRTFAQSRMRCAAACTFRRTQPRERQLIFLLICSLRAKNSAGAYSHYTFSLPQMLQAEGPFGLACDFSYNNSLPRRILGCSWRDEITKHQFSLIASS